MTPQWIDFTPRGDERGLLVPMEAEREVPFPIKRIYTLLNLSAGLSRGGHAHRRLRQAIVCLSGHCTVVLDDGSERAVLHLDSPSRALLLEPRVWHEMQAFSEGCVLLVMADDYYDEQDYIRDRPTFLDLAKEWRA